MGQYFSRCYCISTGMVLVLPISCCSHVIKGGQSSQFIIPRFALGAVLYQLLFRTFAFVKETKIQSDIATRLGDLPLIPCGRPAGLPTCKGWRDEGTKGGRDAMGAPTNHQQRPVLVPSKRADKIQHWVTHTTYTQRWANYVFHRNRWPKLKFAEILILVKRHGLRFQYGPGICHLAF